MSKVLALDYGSKNIGIATGDLRFSIAFPRCVIDNKGPEFVINSIVDLCEELNVQLVVLGLPLNMEEAQEDNPIKKDVVLLQSGLMKAGMEVVMVDERLSSFEAKSRTGKRRDVDAEAAQIILQRYFDNLAG